MASRRWKWAAGGSSALVLAIAGALGLHYEGMRTTAYSDPVGVLTICAGHTQGVQAGDVATVAECEQYMREDMREANGYVRQCITRPLPITVEAAFTDAAYNIGPSVVCGSTLQRKANSGDIEGACKELMRWVYAGGEIMPGLVNRRTAEVNLCLEGLQ